MLPMAFISPLYQYRREENYTPLFTLTLAVTSIMRTLAAYESIRVIYTNLYVTPVPILLPHLHLRIAIRKAISLMI